LVPVVDPPVFVVLGVVVVVVVAGAVVEDVVPCGCAATSVAAKPAIPATRRKESSLILPPSLQLSDYSVWAF
jgi:hypothetical protein